MKTSTKLILLSAAAAVSLAAAPVYAGKQSTPGATGATTTLSAVPPAADAAPSGSTSVGAGSVVLATSVSASTVAQIKATPGAFTTTFNGETVTALAFTEGGQDYVAYVTDSGELTVVTA